MGRVEIIVAEVMSRSSWRRYVEIIVAEARALGSGGHRSRRSSQRAPGPSL